MEASQYRSLVVAGFEGLRAGLNVHQLDLQPVLDQCHETLHEIDVTEYLHVSDTPRDRRHGVPSRE